MYLYIYIYIYIYGVVAALGRDGNVYCIIYRQYSCMHVCMYVRVCVCKYNICIRARARARTHTHNTHTDTHTHTQIGRQLGLSSSLPASMWQELRKAGSGAGLMGVTGGGGGGASSHGTTRHGTSHGTSAAHTPYAHTPYTHSHYSASSDGNTGNTGNTGYNSNPFTATSHFSSASELSYGERDARKGRLIHYTKLNHVLWGAGRSSLSRDSCTPQPKP